MGKGWLPCSHLGFYFFFLLFKATPFSSGRELQIQEVHRKESLNTVCSNSRAPAAGAVVPTHSPGLVLRGSGQAVNSKSNIVLRTNFSCEIFHGSLAAFCLICTLCQPGDSIPPSWGTGKNPGVKAVTDMHF